MSKPKGRSQRAIENLAAALQECLDVASENAAERAAERAAEHAAEHAAERAAERAATRVKAELEPRLDRQDETLRMIWMQCGGKEGQRLPIDG